MNNRHGIDWFETGLFVVGIYAILLGLVIFTTLGDVNFLKVVGN